MIGTDVRQFSISYRSFKTLLDSGHDLRGALGFLRESAKGEARTQAARLLATVESGRKLSEGMKELSYPEIDVALIEVGETTGFLPEVAAMLATHYDERVQMLKAIRGALPQPLLLLTVSLVTSPLPALVAEKISLTHYMTMVFVPLAILLGLLYAGFETYRRMLFSRELRLRVSSKLDRIPGIRHFNRLVAMERFLNCAALALKAGCDFFETARLLAVVSEGTYMRSAPAILKNHAPNEGVAQAMARTKLFSVEQIGSAKLGETTGTLARQFEGMAQRARAEVHGEIQLFTVWAPRILYGLMMIYVAYGILSNAMSSPLVKGIEGLEE